MTIIKPGDMTVDGNKYKQDLSEIEPAVILSGIHRRVVGAENRIKVLADHLSNHEVELEMMEDKIKELEKTIARIIDQYPIREEEKSSE